ncbi:MAG TPA: hypothetical protein VHD61_04630 [Lacunisphaera sp.]|nr:hypothetical protein [Lacunisphaera sp.]
MLAALLAAVFFATAHALVPIGNIGQTSKYKRVMSKPEAVSVIKGILPFHELPVGPPHDYCFPTAVDESGMTVEWRRCVDLEMKTKLKQMNGLQGFGIYLVDTIKYHHIPGETRRVDFDRTALILVMPEILGAQRKWTPGRTFFLLGPGTDHPAEAIFTCTEDESKEMAAALLNLCPNLENFPSGWDGLKAVQKAYPAPQKGK